MECVYTIVMQIIDKRYNIWNVVGTCPTGNIGTRIRPTWKNIVVQFD